MTQAPVTEEEAKKIILEWARLHDLQAGLSAFLPIIAEEGFYMEFGGKRWEGYADFEDHQITKRKFFDEVHEYFDIRVDVGEEKTIAKTKMNSTYRYRPERSPGVNLSRSSSSTLGNFSVAQKPAAHLCKGTWLTFLNMRKGSGRMRNKNTIPTWTPNGKAGNQAS